jgi:signal transduction histidine kinase
MHTAIDRVDRIVEGLLAYARPEANGAAVGPSGGSETDLNAAVRTAVDFLTAQGMLAGHQVSEELDAALGPVRGGRHGLEQVVINLILNASQAAPRGRIHVVTAARRYERRHGAVGRNGDSPPPRRGWSARPSRHDLVPGAPSALLIVADDGPGVPEADRERIFDPFFTTKEPGEGTGLGLAIVARTVHEAGGVVWVDRAREGGAVFKVFLPLAGANDACPNR